MDRLLANLLRSAYCDTEAESEEAFVKFAAEADLIIQSTLERQLDYWRGFRDDWDDHDPSMFLMVLAQCIQKIDLITELLGHQARMPELGDLQFKAYAAAVIQPLVQSPATAQETNASSLALLQRIEEEIVAVRNRTVSAPQKHRSRKKRPEFNLLELIDGPELTEAPHPFVASVACWNSNSNDEIQTRTDPIGGLPENNERVKQYRSNWKTLYRRLWTKAHSKRLDEGSATDLVERVLRKVLRSDPEKMKQRSIYNPYGYASQAMKRLERDEFKRSNRHVPIINDLESASSSPTEEARLALSDKFKRLRHKIEQIHSPIQRECAIARFVDFVSQNHVRQLTAQKLFYVLKVTIDLDEITQQWRRTRAALVDVLGPDPFGK